jgi:hypothetical protein
MPISDRAPFLWPETVGKETDVQTLAIGVIYRTVFDEVDRLAFVFTEVKVAGDGQHIDMKTRTVVVT